MKKLLTTTFAGAAVTVAANGQGTVNFKNYFSGTTSDPLVYSLPGTPAYGPQFQVCLFGGSSEGNMVLLATTNVSRPGYFVGPAVAVPGVPGGSIGTFQVGAWDSTLGGTTTGATFQQALAYVNATSREGIWGISFVFTNPTGVSLGTPADLLNMPSVLMYFPEPSPAALGLLAAAMALARTSRRFHQSKTL